MNDKKERNKWVISRNELPEQFPTHAHSPQFWEHLGRTVATYGFLEEVLGKAIYALTAIRHYSAEKIDEAYQAWLPQLEKALTDQLWNLAETYGKAVRDNPEAITPNSDELVENIKEASITRNILCHGSWPTPDSEGKSVPLFVNRQKEVFQGAIDVEFLKQVQTHVAGLTCSVIDTVTVMGWEFPGGAGPGEQIAGKGGKQGI